MKIQEILRKQGELYKNLTSNKAIKEYNEKIKPPKQVPYHNIRLEEKEYEAIKGLEKLLNEEPVIVGGPKFNYSFEMSANNNSQITYLRIARYGLMDIPKEISSLTNLQKLVICGNYIKEIENLDNLTNLKELDLYDNWIEEIKNLDNLRNIKMLNLNKNQITEIKNLDNLHNLQTLSISSNQISKLENLDNLQNLEKLDLTENPVKNKSWPFSKNRKEIKKLRKKGVGVYI